MNKVLIVAALLIFNIAFCQINYEQAAFNFYKDSILKNDSSTKYLRNKTSESHYYLNIECLKEFKFHIDDTAAVPLTTNRRIIKKLQNNDKRFLNRSKRKLPIVFATTALEIEEQKFLAAIVEEHKEHFVTYLIELNSEGVIGKWCLGTLPKEL